jgi:ParB family chromosome partitioning protein
MSQFFGDSIFWIEVDKIKPNPYQPRREFDDARLKDLADSIRMYGVLQPLVVTRTEREKDDGGLTTEYELISGERRLRASKLAGVREVPAIIRRDTDDGRLKLELAIIENLQREDLNPVDRARAFKQLIDEFKFKHSQVAEKVGKSREYVSNSLRILELPEEILSAVVAGRLSEGHTRPLLMLTGRAEEQMTLFREILLKKLTVRDTERIARGIAIERVRKPETLPDADTMDIAQRLSEALGTRVEVERRGAGGRLHVDFFSAEDLAHILDLLKTNTVRGSTAMMDAYIARQAGAIRTAASEAVVATETASASPAPTADVPATIISPVASTVDHVSAPTQTPVVTQSVPVVPVTVLPSENNTPVVSPVSTNVPTAPVVATEAPTPVSSEVPSDVAVPLLSESAPIDDRSEKEKQEDEADLYSIKNFSL